MAAIKICGGIGFPGFGWGNIPAGGIAGLFKYGLLFEIGIAPPPAGLNSLEKWQNNTINKLVWFLLAITL